MSDHVRLCVDVLVQYCTVSPLARQQDPGKIKLLVSNLGCRLQDSCGGQSSILSMSSELLSDTCFQPSPMPPLAGTTIQALLDHYAADSAADNSGLSLGLLPE